MPRYFLVLFAVLSLLFGCSPQEVEMPTQEQPPPDLTAKRGDVVARLPAFLDRGFVVSLKDGAPQHQGDSLFFSGLALYSLSCKEGKPVADALLAMLTELDGGVYRHPDQKDREPSLDGLLALYRGVAKRISCGEVEPWATAMKNHRARMAASLPAEFNLVSDTISYKLGLSDEPDMARLHNLAVEVASWAQLVIAGKKACYRIHLGLLALQGMQDMGYPVSDLDRGKFAEVTNGLKMATIDHFAGRQGLDKFLTEFSYDQWQYKPQRCVIWERQDGDGMAHPGIDYLVGYADLFGSPK